MHQTTTNRPALLALLAGSAFATAPGCAVTSSHTIAQDEPAARASEAMPPRSATFYSSAPVRYAGPAVRESTPHDAMIDTSALADAGVEGLSSNTWAELGGGWSMVTAASDAEREAQAMRSQVATPTYTVPAGGSAFTRDPFASPTARSGDLSSDLYDTVLGGALPREAEGGDSGKNTANVRQVTFTHFGADFDPMISRDGTRIIYASTQHRETADIYIKDVNSRVMTRLTNDPGQDVMPSISPDGRYIAFSSNREGTWNLYMMPTSGGTAVQLTNDSTHDLHPSWSPDGRRIVFSRLGQSSGRWELWVMDIANPGAHQFIGYGLFPEWCPVQGTGPFGSDRIVFQRSRERGDRAFSVWTIDYTDEPGVAMRETEIVNSATEALINPSWSPDGEFVLYASVPNNQSWQAGPTGSPTQTGLWMIGADGRGRVNVVSGSTINLMPVWGPGDEIFFVSNRSGVENLWAINVGEAVTTASAQRGAGPGRATDFATVPVPGRND